MAKKYKGKLSFQQLSDGINLCLENAQALVKEARLLLEHQHFARATTLAIVAMEELGKVHILLAMAQIHPKNQKL